MATQRRRRRIPGHMEDVIKEKVVVDWTPAQIHKELERRFPHGGVPTLRTVQRIVAELTPRDPTKPWHIGDDVDDEEAALVLPVLAEVVIKSEGRKREFTQREARWIARIRRIAPDLDLFIVYQWSRIAVVYESEGLPAIPVEHLLAFLPRRGEPLEDTHERWELAAGWLGTFPSPKVDWSILWEGHPGQSLRAPSKEPRRGPAARVDATTRSRKMPGPKGRARGGRGARLP